MSKKHKKKARAAKTKPHTVKEANRRKRLRENTKSKRASTKLKQQSSSNNNSNNSDSNSDSNKCKTNAGTKEEVVNDRGKSGGDTNDTKQLEGSTTSTTEW
mmetsp:Transcript_1336/g.2837  ORF Transcript_1336/g.2837 Transcript_1336/m.2837 type:complete len:101 (-) Transcript_1336:897-1199(-)